MFRKRRLRKQDLDTQIFTTNMIQFQWNTDGSICVIFEDEELGFVNDEWSTRDVTFVKSVEDAREGYRLNDTQGLNIPVKLDSFTPYGMIIRGKFTILIIERPHGMSFDYEIYIEGS